MEEKQKASGKGAKLLSRGFKMIFFCIIFFIGSSLLINKVYNEFFATVVFVALIIPLIIFGVIISLIKIFLGLFKNAGNEFKKNLYLIIIILLGCLFIYIVFYWVTEILLS